MRELEDLDDGAQSEHLNEALGGHVLRCVQGGHGGEVGELDVLGNGEIGLCICGACGVNKGRPSPHTSLRNALLLTCPSGGT